MEGFNADGAAPGALGRHLHGRDEAVHVVAAVAVVAEEELVVVLAGAAECAGLALDTLPGIFPDADQHVVSELETGGMTGPATLRATNQLLRLQRLLVEAGVSQAEVTVTRWWSLVKSNKEGLVEKNLTLTT